ncbi:MAG: hypothetical protein ACREPM_05935 [Gemmatimonadaceae bacterium]
MTRVARTLVALLVAAQTAGAQEPSLASKLDKPTLLAVTAIIDSARAAKLPTKPLNDKALEGAASGADGPKIVAAVRHLSNRMSSARRALSAGASADEIKSAVGALEVGVSTQDLARVKSAAGKRPVTMPLAVLTDLIGRQVPIPTATALVLQLERNGVKDSELSLYQRNVRADIERGADPTAAATTRAKGVVQRGGGNTSKPS